MELGAFSVSLSVKNIKASIEFYEKLGFTQIGGNCSDGWTILKNGEHIIGLFQGMFEKNMLTFNPGWDQASKELVSFTDVRDIRNELKSKGIEIESDGALAEAGPGSIVIIDPDGNPILIDQHR